MGHYSLDTQYILFYKSWVRDGRGAEEEANVEEVHHPRREESSYCQCHHEEESGEDESDIDEEEEEEDETEESELDEY